MIIASYKDCRGDCHWPQTNIGSAKFYGVDWGEYLAHENDTITAENWIVPGGLTGSDESQVMNQARIKLAANTVGEYEVSCKINTVEAGDTQIHIQKMNLEVV